MAAEIFRKPAHVSSSGGMLPIRTYHFGVKGTINESTVRSLAQAYYGPEQVTSFGKLYLGDITCDQTAWDKWDVDVDYSLRPRTVGTFTWEHDGTGVTEHITHSLSTVAKYPAATAPNFKQTIGVEKDQIVGGDVIRPHGQLTVIFTHPAGYMSILYSYYLEGITGTVNSTPFMLRAPGEVRFMGARTTAGTETECVAVYTFEISRNKTGITVGDVTGIDKLGWDLSWTFSEDGEDTVGGVTYPIKKPKFVYIERVTTFIDMAAALGFGA